MKKSRFTGINHIANKWSRKHQSYPLNTDKPVVFGAGDRLNQENKQMKISPKRSRYIKYFLLNGLSFL